MDCCVWLFALGVGLVVVAVVGHGLWLGVAALFNAFNGTDRVEDRPAARREPEAEECAGCGVRLLPREDVCPECGLERGGKQATQLSELDTARRQIVTLRRQ